MFIKFPRSNAEMNATKELFMRIYNIPGTLGIMDGTHVALSATKTNIERAYLNRKSFHSINALVVSDARMVITYANARYPGSNHDSFIFSSTLLFAFLRDYHNRHPNELSWLIGKLLVNQYFFLQFKYSFILFHI